MNIIHEHDEEVEPCPICLFGDVRKGGKTCSERCDVILIIGVAGIIIETKFSEFQQQKFDLNVYKGQKEIYKWF